MVTIGQLLVSLFLAIFTGTWQPAPAAMVGAVQSQPLLAATWHPFGQAGNEQDYLFIAADGSLTGGATSSAVSPAKH